MIFTIVDSKNTYWIKLLNGFAALTYIKEAK